MKIILDPKLLETTTNPSANVYSTLMTPNKEIKMTDEIDINIRNCYGCTPLHCAIEGGSPEAVELLIKNGADITAVAQNGETVFHKLARSSEKLNIMQLILDQQKSTADAQKTIQVCH